MIIMIIVIVDALLLLLLLLVGAVGARRSTAMICGVSPWSLSLNM